MWLQMDIPDLLAQIDGRTVRVATGESQLATRGARFETIRPDWRQRLLSVIANPELCADPDDGRHLRADLRVLVARIRHPRGRSVRSACCSTMFALQLLPTNYAGLGPDPARHRAAHGRKLLSPSFGVLGVGGVIAFIAGGLLLFDRDIPGFGVPLRADSRAGREFGRAGSARRRSWPCARAGSRSSAGREDMIGAVAEVIAVAADDRLGAGPRRTLEGSAAVSR